MAQAGLAAASAHAQGFARIGLQALEAVRPGLDRTTRRGLARVAKAHGLDVTGGSDWHGFGEPRLGLFSWQGEAAEAFLRRLDA